MKQTNIQETLNFLSKELTKKLLITLGLLTLIRLGTFIPVPGIDQTYLTNFLKNSPIAGFVNTFSDGGKVVIGLFTLNIFPYINACILMQVLVSTIPSLEYAQKEDGAAGRQKITQITRYITLGWAIIQSASIAIFLKDVLFDWNWNLALQIIICLTTGAIVVMWFSELITEHGIGNGSSLLIFTNIVSNLPNLANIIFSKTEPISNASKACVILILFVSICGIIYLQEAVRIVSLVSSKELNTSDKGFSTELSKGNYIPLRLNQAGVMPIIFTATLLVLPAYFVNLGFIPNITFGIFSKVIYWITYFILILLFSYLYSTVVLSPKDISKNLRRMAVTVPKIRPGEPTTFFFQQIMKRITFIGAIFLAIITTLPNVVELFLNVPNLKGLGTTSLLILVGVTIDTTREVRSIVLSNIYKNMIDLD